MKSAAPENSAPAINIIGSSVVHQGWEKYMVASIDPTPPWNPSARTRPNAPKYRKDLRIDSALLSSLSGELALGRNNLDIKLFIRALPPSESRRPSITSRRNNSRSSTRRSAKYITYNHTTSTNTEWNWGL